MSIASKLSNNYANYIPNPPEPQNPSITLTLSFPFYNDFYTRVAIYLLIHSGITEYQDSSSNFIPYEYLLNKKCLLL